MRSSQQFLAFIALVLLVGCNRDSGYLVELEALAVPAAPGSLAPAWSVTPKGEALLSWQMQDQRVTELKFARFAKERWSEPRTIASGDNWFVNWADFPSMLALDEERLVAHWLERSGPGTYAYDVHLTRSLDGGATWQPLGKAHDDGLQTEHGFVALYPYLDAVGVREAGLVWLDGRHMTPGDHHGGMSLRHARLTGDGSLTEQEELDPLTCDCCQTAAIASGADVLVAYRDRSEEEIRDIRLLRRTDAGWQDQGLIREDGWEIPGCPVNGPALAAEQEHVAIAWFSAASGQPRVRAGISSDHGRRFKLIEIEDEEPEGRVDVALLGELFAVSWLSKAGGGGRLRLQVFDLDGNPRSLPQDLVKVTASRAAGFPRLLAADGQLLLAWTEVTDVAKQVHAARLVLTAR